MCPIHLIYINDALLTHVHKMWSLHYDCKKNQIFGGPCCMYMYNVHEHVHVHVYYVHIIGEDYCNYDYVQIIICITCTIYLLLKYE